MRPICRYRQHLFNCGLVVFHRSCAAAGGRNEPLLVVVLGLKGWRTIICWQCYIAWYVSCLGCYCTHVTWHSGTLRDCLIDVELSTSMFLFTVTSCEISTWTWGRVLHIQSRTCGEHSLWIRRMELFSRKRRLPCVEEQLALALKGWHVEMSRFLAVGWVTDIV